MGFPGSNRAAKRPSASNSSSVRRAISAWLAPELPAAARGRSATGSCTRAGQGPSPLSVVARPAMAGMRPDIRAMSYAGSEGLVAPKHRVRVPATPDGEASAWAQQKGTRADSHAPGIRQAGRLKHELLCAIILATLSCALSGLLGDKLGRCVLLIEGSERYPSRAVNYQPRQVYNCFSSVLAV